MTLGEKYDYIDEFLTHQENFCHGEEGEQCTQSRVYIRELREQALYESEKPTAQLRVHQTFCMELENVAKENPGKTLKEVPEFVNLITAIEVLEKLFPGVED